MNAGDLRQKLKSETRAAHDSLELALDVMREDLASGHLVRILSSLLIFHTAFERRMRVLSGQGHVRAAKYLEHSRKSQWLPALNLDLINPSAEPDLKWIDCDSTILGATYVIEGSMLGGAIVGPHLKELGFAANQVRYFAGYGAEGAHLWRQLVQELGEYPEVYWPLVTRAAGRTFESLKQVFQQTSIKGGLPNHGKPKPIHC